MHHIFRYYHRLRGETGIRNVPRANRLERIVERWLPIDTIDIYVHIITMLALRSTGSRSNRNRT